MAQGKPAAPIQDRDEAARVLAEYATVESELAAVAVKLVNDAATLHTASEQTSAPLRVRLEQLAHRLETWAMDQRAALPQGDSASITLATGTMSWRRVPNRGGGPPIEAFVIAPT